MKISPKLKPIAWETLLYIFLTIGALIVIFPALWVLLTALKPSADMFRLPVSLLPRQGFTLEHFIKLNQIFPLPRLLLNTFFIASTVAASSVFFSTMVGYGFAKFKNRVNDILFLVILSSIMIPFFVRLIPLYLTMVRFGGADTFWGLILPNYISVFGIFFMRQYAVTIPDELLQAARIDGASEFQILLRMIFPLMKSAIVTLLAIKFLWTWNDFLWPLVMLSSPTNLTLPVALAAFKGHLITRYGPLMAGAVVLLLPVLILFLFLQRQIVQGIALSGMKS